MDFQNQNYPGRIYVGDRPTIKKAGLLSKEAIEKRFAGQLATYSNEFGAFYQTSVKDEKPKK